MLVTAAIANGTYLINKQNEYNFVPRVFLLYFRKAKYSEANLSDDLHSDTRHTLFLHNPLQRRLGTART